MTWTTPHPTPEEAPVPHVAGPYAALDHLFTVSVPTGDDTVDGLVDEVHRVLAHLTVTATIARSQYVVTRLPDGLSLTLDDEPIEAGPAPAHVLAMLLWDINRRAVSATSDHVILHAGAITVSGGAIALPAAMEAGKTTLVTGLVRAGCGYLSDELAALPAPDVSVRPYPKAISLDPGSWPLFPDLQPDPAQGDWSPTQWLVDADRIHAGAVRLDPVPLRGVVFPRHRPGGDTAIQRLRPPEALRALAMCAFGFHDDPAAVLPRLAGIAERVPTWSLSTGDGVTEAVDAVLDVLGDELP